MKSDEYRKYKIEIHGRRFRVFLDKRLSVASVDEAKLAIDKHLERSEVIDRAEARFVRGKLADLFTQYMDYKNTLNLREASLKNISIHYHWFMNDNPTLVHIDEITVDKWQTYMIEKLGHLEQISKSQFLLHVRAFVRWASGAGFYVNPAFLKYSIPSGKEFQEGARPATQEEVETILRLAKAKSAHVYIPLLLIANFGVRPREMERILKEDYDEKTKTLTIKARAAKTKKARSFQVEGELAEQLYYAKSNWKSEYLLVNRWQKPWGTKSLFTMFRCFMKANKLSSDVTMYSFRKYAANQICGMVSDIRLCYEILGHSDEVFNSYYEMHSKDKKLEVAQRVATEVAGNHKPKEMFGFWCNGEWSEFASLNQLSMWYKTFRKPKKLCGPPVSCLNSEKVTPAINGGSL